MMSWSSTKEIWQEFRLGSCWIECLTPHKTKSRQYWISPQKIKCNAQYQLFKKVPFKVYLLSSTISVFAIVNKAKKRAFKFSIRFYLFIISSDILLHFTYVKNSICTQWLSCRLFCPFCHKNVGTARWRLLSIKMFRLDNIYQFFDPSPPLINGTAFFRRESIRFRSFFQFRFTWNIQEWRKQATLDWQP